MDSKVIREKLASRMWFQASALGTQRQLLDLPVDCDGLLEHLANRPDEGGGVRLTMIDEVLIPKARPIFGIFIVFVVQNLSDPNKRFCYQYFSWKQGPLSGAKGLVLVRKGNAITHVCLLRGFSFAVGGETFDCPGGFSDPAKKEEGAKAMVKRFLIEVQEELGIVEPQVVETLELGSLLPDRGMTPNQPMLCAVVIEGAEINPAHQNPDPFEMRSGAIIVPEANLWGANGFIQCNTDAYFLATLARLIGLGVIKSPTC